jgi:acyl carrier protein
MNNSTIDVVAEVIRETFDAPNAVILRETVAEDIPGWDSLSNTILFMTLENRLGIRFEADVNFENVGVLADEVEKLRQQ